MIAQVPLPIQNEIILQLKCRLVDFEFIPGGCINSGGKLKTSTGVFFLKWNSAEKYPNMFSAEAKGLQLLKAASSIKIPEAILTSTADNIQVLLLEFIDGAAQAHDYWKKFGEQLSALHKNSSKSFGLDLDNYIGSLPQRNVRHNSWVTFYIEERLRPQCNLALANGKITSSLAHKFDKLFENLPQLITEEKPALLHGDLWSGNLITDQNGNPCLIDPAVFYGNREAEIAFTKLFGGFNNQFYDSYHSNFPLENGFHSRIGLYNLYPLMVHANLFGGGYLNQVVSILRNYV